jgi:hypothetical protein
MVKYLPVVPDILVVVVSLLAAYRWYVSTTIQSSAQFGAGGPERKRTKEQVPGDRTLCVGCLNSLGWQIRHQPANRPHL